MHRRLIRIAVFVSALVLVLPVSASAGSSPAEVEGGGCGALIDKLSAPVPIKGDVRAFEISPDGSRVVYRADAEADGLWDLYIVGLLGGPVVKFDRPFEPGGNAGRFLISPRNDRVVFWAYEVSNQQGELFSVPIEGSPVTPLTGPLGANRGVLEWSFEISPLGDLVIFLAEYQYGKNELFSVRAAGGTVTRLNPLGPADDIRYFGISSDGSLVWYVGEQETDDIRELYLVPSVGGEAMKLNEPLVPGGQVYFGQFTPDGNYIVYHTDKHVVGVYEVWSIRLADMQRFRLSLDPVAGGRVDGEPHITPDGSRIVYRGDMEVDERFELYSVGIEGGPTTKLSGPMIPGGGVVYRGFAISPDGSTVVYKADQVIEYVYELYSVPVTGGTITKLNPPLPTSRRVTQFAIDPTSTRVVYTADQDTDNIVELYSVPIGGGVPTTKLNAPYIAASDTQQFTISPDGSSVAYRADQEADRVYELYQVSITGGATTKLNDPLVDGGDVFDDEFRKGEEFRFDPGTNLVAYIADQEVDNAFELYRSLLPDRDTDGDLQDNCVDPCPLDADDDSDNDGFCGDVDCEPADGDLWQVPGQIVDLMLDRAGDPPDTTLLAWSAPSDPGGTLSPSYDTVRTTGVTDFGSVSAVCVESGDATDTIASDTDVPGALFFYLVLPSNACGRTPGEVVATRTRQIRECP